MRRFRCLALTAAVLAAAGVFASRNAADPPEGFKELFNGKNFDGWTVPEGDNGHWKILDGGVIDYDAKSEAKKSKDLWTAKEYKNFILRVDWRLKKDKGLTWKVPVIGPDGATKQDKDGKPMTVEIEDIDSGIYLRGTPSAQVNIWCWPVGSGEVYGYRTNMKMPAEVRAAVTPKVNADKPRGEWNTFEIKVVKDRLWVKLNGKDVIENAQLPGLKESGRIGLQHHGAWDAKKGEWRGPPSLVQFKNIYIKELD
jgi:hypothetical protein